MYNRYGKDGMEVGLNDEMLEEVRRFKFLGPTITPSGGVKIDVSNRLNEGCNFLSGVKKIMRNRKMDMKINKVIYENVLAPTVMYESGLWCSSIQRDEDQCVWGEMLKEYGRYN